MSTYPEMPVGGLFPAWTGGPDAFFHYREGWNAAVTSIVRTAHSRGGCGCGLTANECLAQRVVEA